jgi:hypothetical protein
MRAAHAVRALFVLTASVGCGGTSKNDYAEAAVWTGVAVAEVGFYRALTHGCWAACRPGYLCNAKNGLCEVGECLPGCEFGWHCVRDATGKHYCVPDATGATAQSSLHATPIPDGGLATDAGAADAATMSPVDAATDAAEQ